MKQKLFNASVKLGAVVSLTLFALGASAPGRFSDF